jgi:hypothetical protein
MKPTTIDILGAMATIAAGRWLDPADAPPHWRCVLYDKKGETVSDGEAFDPAEAMALAWIFAFDNVCLECGRVEVAGVPFHIPRDWVFELTPDYVYTSPLLKPGEILHELDCASYRGLSCDCDPEIGR